MYCKLKYRADETTAARPLRGEGSVASSIYTELHLPRSKIKAVLTRLQNGRRRRMVFASIICATRFELFFPDNDFQTVKCMRCGEPDSFDHLLQCCGIEGVPHTETVDYLIDFLIELTREAAEGGPVPPVRYSKPEIDEISFTADNNGADPAVSDEESLGGPSFEFTEEVDEMN